MLNETGLLPYRHWPGVAFALRGLTWSVVLIGLQRLALIEATVVLPLTRWQGRIAEAVFGAAPYPVAVTVACSAADALALCAGAILAYPASWRARLLGAGGGVCLILALNTARIATLGRAAGSAALFETMHLIVWPGVITMAIAIYVFAWMRRAGGSLAPPVTAPDASVSAPDPHAARRARRFVGLSAVLLAVFVAGVPALTDSGVVLAMAGVIAGISADLMSAFGLHAGATANVLWTRSGGYLVTADCILTPLIPVYAAAVATYARPHLAAAAAMAAAVPLFLALGVARLLVVALPPTLVESPLFFVHAFYQLTGAAIAIACAVWWRRGGTLCAGRWAGIAVAAGIVTMVGSQPVYAHAIASATALGLRVADPQGAVAFLPVFQLGLYVALSISLLRSTEWRAFLPGLALLTATQVAAFALLDLAARHAGLAPHPRDIRAWALSGPILLLLLMVTHARARR